MMLDARHIVNLIDEVNCSEKNTIQTETLPKIDKEIAEALRLKEAR